MTRSERAAQVFVNAAREALLKARKFSIHSLRRIASQQMRQSFEHWRRRCQEERIRQRCTSSLPSTAHAMPSTAYRPDKLVIASLSKGANLALSTSNTAHAPSGKTTNEELQRDLEAKALRRKAEESARAGLEQRVQQLGRAFDETGQRQRCAGDNAAVN